jgi:hypothetical protein
MFGQKDPQAQSDSLRKPLNVESKEDSAAEKASSAEKPPSKARDYLNRFFACVCCESVEEEQQQAPDASSSTNQPAYRRGCIGF